MVKRISSFLLCAMLLLSMALPVCAVEDVEPEFEKLVIYHEMNFLKFAEKCRLDSYSQNLIVELKEDLDLTGMDFSGIPMFCGTFEGNGHSIKGLELTQDASDIGLFRYLSDTAIVKNLHAEGMVEPSGTRNDVGGIVGNNAGQILGCSFSGTVSGNNYVGGIAGKNELTGIIEDCQVSGSVTGSHFAGGISGLNGGVVRLCENLADVNVTAVENLVDLTEITLESMTYSEFAATVTDIGGIAGTSNGVIRDSSNYGEVGYRSMGYNIGGIAGTQSGLIQNCVNFGGIQGRKEIGGIVGQLEPTALIQYEEDALQILQKQLNGMGNTVEATVSNVQGTSNAIIGQVSTLHGHLENAREAMKTLIPDAANPELPDHDTIQAAQNTLSTSFSGMSTTLQGMSGTAYNAMGAITTNLYTMQSQMNAMRKTIGNASETLGGSIMDVSDKDTEDDMTGKISDCLNFGEILADRNAGGIAGSMAMENDLDAREDWTLKGSNSLNFESELRAVIVNCENSAHVTVKKENAGGITGWQSMGLIKNSRNSGKINGSAADYVGGISGQSKGFIRNCSAKSRIQGNSYVGGIAGSATILSDCLSMATLDTTGEMIGAVLGNADTPYVQTELPVSNNYYFKGQRDIGGIDGISYAGQAEPLDMEEFLAVENLPEMFHTVFVRFQYPNGTERAIPVPIGGSFDKKWTPPLPLKENTVSFWDGLETADMSGLLHDVTFKPGYRGKKTAISSMELRNNVPVLLVQGDFEMDAAVAMTKLEQSSFGEDGDWVETWAFEVTGANILSAVRLRLPEGMDADCAAVQIRSADGSWREMETVVDGSYLVVPLQSGDSAITLLEKSFDYTILLYGLLGLSVGALLFLRRRRKTKD